MAGKIKNLFLKLVLKFLTTNESQYALEEEKNINILNSNYPQLPLVSIIIPCFNSKDKISISLDSIIKQKYFNFEILVIDDGSTQRVDAEIAGYHDKRIKYFYKDNEGPGLTRNYGIDKAEGDYVFFLDSDDSLYMGALANMVLYALDNDVEVVYAMTYRVDLVNNSSWPWRPNMFKKSSINNDVNTRLKYYRDNLTTNKLYQKKVFAKYDLFFLPGLYEDKPFSASIYSRVSSIGILKRRVYNWNIFGSGTSISTSKSIANFKERLTKFSIQFQNTLEYGRSYLLGVFISHDIYIQLREEYKTFSEDEKDEMFILCTGFIKKYEKYYDSKQIPIRKRTSIKVYKALSNNDKIGFNRIANSLTK